MKVGFLRGISHRNPSDLANTLKQTHDGAERILCFQSVTRKNKRYMGSDLYNSTHGIYC